MKLKRTYLSHAIAAALLVAASNLAFAADEVEPNDRIFADDGRLAAQRLTFSTSSMEIWGTIGTADPNGTPTPDVDFYAFDAQAGDTLTVDVDFGMKADLALRSVDTVLAIFGPLPSVAIVRENNDTLATVPRDPDSVHIFDALITNFYVNTGGTYVVGVSSKPRSFVNGGGTTNSTVTGRTAMFPNGKYKLTISGVTPGVQTINIAIKPGSGEKAPVNLKAKGNIPVALLSHDATPKGPAFNAMTVDPASLTFGSTGDENSYLRCSKEGLDVNADGLLDLVCHFDNQAAKWQPEDLEGTVKGMTKGGVAFEGSGPLKVVPKGE